MEKTITLEYLTNLNNAYNKFIEDISKIIPVRSNQSTVPIDHG
jgi:hypothetical protein